MNKLQKIGAQTLVLNILKAAVSGQPIQLRDDQKIMIQEVIEAMQK